MLFSVFRFIPQKDYYFTLYWNNVKKKVGNIGIADPEAWFETAPIVSFLCKIDISFNYNHFEFGLYGRAEFAYNLSNLLSIQ